MARLTDEQMLRALEHGAYYYVFDATGVVSIDRILGAISQAGKAFHHTESWSERQDWLDGKSFADLIQVEALAAADRVQQLRGALTEALDGWEARAAGGGVVDVPRIAELRKLVQP